MARPREPIALVKAKGKKHLSKAEIEEREASEPQPCTDEIVAPSYLTAAQKKRFDKLASQLLKIKIMGETDCETLARYVTAQELYEQAVKELRSHTKLKPKKEDFDSLESYYNVQDLWFKGQDSLARLIDRYFKQATASARELGLTISSRCKLQVPVKEETPVTNKFAAFEVIPGGDQEAAGR